MDYSGRFLSSPPIAAVPLLVSLARALRPLLSAFEYTLIPASNVSERDQLFLKALFGWVVKEKKNPPKGIDSKTTPARHAQSRCKVHTDNLQNFGGVNVPHPSHSSILPLSLPTQKHNSGFHTCETWLHTAKNSNENHDLMGLQNEIAVRARGIQAGTGFRIRLFMCATWIMEAIVDNGTGVPTVFTIGRWWLELVRSL